MELLYVFTCKKPTNIFLWEGESMETFMYELNLLWNSWNSLIGQYPKMHKHIERVRASVYLGKKDSGLISYAT